MDRSKFDVTVVACGPGEVAAAIGAYADTYHNLGTGSYPSLRKIKNGKLREDFLARFYLIWWLIKSIWKLSRWLHKEKIDLIHTNSLQFSLIAGVAGRLTKVPSVWHIREPKNIAWRRGGPFLVEGYMASWLATKFIANSHFTARGFHKSWKKKTVVIWNSIEVQDIVSHQHPGKLREITNISNNEKLVGILGQIEHRKGLDRFIRMAAKVAHVSDDVRFVIVGGEVTHKQISQVVKADLVRLVEEVGVTDRLCFTGNIDNAPYYMGDMDAFFMCSRPGTETFGLVVIEAMAANVPVVAFSNDAMPEIIEDGKTGFLVPEGDIDLAAKCIIEILNDKTLTQNIRKAARNHVENTFDIRILTEKVQNLYFDLLRK